jgi:serine/threonine-protein kinase
MSNEELMREALAEMGQLLDKPRAERAAVLNSLAHSKPDLHALVMDLLEYETSVNRGFMETGDGSNGNATLKEDSRLGPYRLIRLLGEGGMGEVWLASRDDGLYEGQVAIKTLHPYFAGGALRARFLREAKVLGRLAHSNIARLLDAGIQDGVVYLVLEYVVGQPIDVACDERKFNVRERLGIFLRLCDAVAHAHSSLVVHRDIKPGNVLLTEDGVPKLLDFGIANFYEAEAGGKPSDLTRLTGRIFTPEYAAPEQVLGQEITTAADVYSLGVLLHVLLTGRLPYVVTESGRVQLEHAVLHQEPQRMARVLESAEQDLVARNRSVSPANLRRELGGDLENIVQKALKKRPEERYLTAAAFAEDIRRYLQGEPIFARADSAWYRLKKFSQRNRLAVGAALAVVIALGIGLAVSLRQLQVSQAERRRAEEANEFTASIFRSADPFFTGKTTLSAVELLALARRRIDQELVDRPQTAIKLLSVVGESQANLEANDAAKATFNRVIELAQRQQPPDVVQIAAAQSWLAAIAQNQGEPDAMGTLLDKALPVLRAHQPGTARPLSNALMHLAYIKYEERDLDAAVAYAREAVAAVSAALGPGNSETLLVKRHLGLFYTLGQRYDEAKPIAEEVLRDARALASSGERAAILILAESLYGRVLHESGGDPEESIRHLNTGIALAAETYGPRSATIVPMLSILKLAQSRQGDMKGMVETARRASEMVDDNLNKSRLLGNLGQSLLMSRQLPQAVEQLRDAVEMGRKYDTSRGSLRYYAQADYASALALSGRFAAADRELQEVFPIATEAKLQRELAAAYNAHGITRQLQFQWSDSESAFRKAMELTSPDSPNQKARSEAILGIGVATLETGDAAAAEKYFRQADEGASRTFLNFIPLRADINLQLGRSLLAQKKIDAARASFAAVDEYWRGYDAGNVYAGEAAYWLGQGHLAAGTKPEALAALTRAIDILKSSPLPGHARLVKDARQAVARL